MLFYTEMKDRFSIVNSFLISNLRHICYEHMPYVQLDLTAVSAGYRACSFAMQSEQPRNCSLCCLGHGVTIRYGSPQRLWQTGTGFPNRYVLAIVSL